MHSTPTLNDFRADAANRRADMQSALERDQDRFENDNPGMIEALRSMIYWNEFAASLVGQFDRKGWLSDRQIGAANSMIAKVAAKQAEKISSTETKSGEVNISKIRALFDTALSNGLKRPKFHAGDVKISLAGPYSRNPGALYVTRDPDVYQGKIVDVTFSASRDCAGDTLEALRALCENPSEYARMTGKATGRCCCCGRELTDPKSIEDGIGPICATKWGL